MDEIRLLPDHSITRVGDQIKDGLDFESYSDVLARATLGTPGPFTIGIFGEWGTGKTSLMALIKDKLEKGNGDSNIATVWFNAWRYEKDDHPILPLIATIVKAINERKPFTQGIGDKAKPFMNALCAVAYGFSLKSKIKVPGFAETEASFVAKDMIEHEQNLNSDPLLEQSLYYNAFERLSEVKLGKKDRVVIFIDDLDRCFPNMAIKLLESIKLVLDQPGFIFFLGVAPRVIEGYLRHRYESRFGIKDFEGREYMDKIVQLPFNIPSHKSRMSDENYHESIKLRLGHRGAQFEELVTTLIPIVGQVSRGNPRSIIRFLNNILIDEAINKRIHQTEGKYGNIPIEYFAVTRALQQNAPVLFGQLVHNMKACEAVIALIEGTVETGQLDDDIMGPIIGLIEGQKALRDLFKGTLGRQWLENEGLRIASYEFLTVERKGAEAQSATKPKYAVYKSNCRRLEQWQEEYGVEGIVLSPKPEEMLADLHKLMRTGDVSAPVIFLIDLIGDEDPISSMVKYHNNSRSAIERARQRRADQYPNAMFGHLDYSRYPELILVFVRRKDPRDPARVTGAPPPPPVIDAFVIVLKEMLPQIEHKYTSISSEAVYTEFPPDPFLFEVPKPFMRTDHD